MCSVDFMDICLLDLYILCVFNQNCGMMVMLKQGSPKLWD